MGTTVTDVETGQPVPMVESIDISIRTDETNKAHLRLACVEVDVIAEDAGGRPRAYLFGNELRMSRYDYARVKDKLEGYRVETCDNPGRHMDEVRILGIL